MSISTPGRNLTHQGISIVFFWRLFFVLSVSAGVSSTSWDNEEVYFSQKDGDGRSSSISSSIRKGFLGCSFTDVCDEEIEECFEDGLFGRCVFRDAQEREDDDEMTDFLTDMEKDGLKKRLLELESEGYTFRDKYTQCVLMSDIFALKTGILYENCQLFKNLDEMSPQDLETEVFNQFDSIKDMIGDEERSERINPLERMLLQKLQDERDDSPSKNIYPNELEESLIPVFENVDRFTLKDEYPPPNSRGYQYRMSEDDDLDDGDKGVFFPLNDSYEDGKEDDEDFEEGVFDRRERYDVKKPGPFFPNSPNNFFLNKLITTSDMNDDSKYSSDEEEDRNAAEEDQGQMEYEMPILAPVNDKNSKNSHIMTSRNMKDLDNNYVHIRLKKRINTEREGEQFINAIADYFDLPSEALRDRLIEDREVHFKVEPNPRNIDAKTMASNLNGNVGKNIVEKSSLEPESAVSGNRSNVFSSTSSRHISSGLLGYQLLILIVVTASSLAALIVTGVIFCLVRRKNNSSRKLKDHEKGAKESLEIQKEVMAGKKAFGAKSEESSAKKQPLQHKPCSVESQRSSTSSGNEEPSASNMDIFTGHMVLAYMEDHLRNKQRLEQEWVALCGYEAEPCSTTAAFRTENKKKNRYPDKLPYDHNRVLLNALLNSEESDYINASPVTDHDPRNPSYIVTQGPMQHTVSDFWQMIWEQGCVVIVMVTRLQEQDLSLCHRYWPQEGSETYHIFEIHLVSEHVWCEDYLVRSFYLKNTRTGETRTVTQFHFRSWPVDGIPTSTKALLEFRRKVNKSYRGRSCPITVHCSDGVGRSGTYVLIDMVLNRMTKGAKEIDIAATLEHIRDQRGGTVQNRQQFEFCLMAVAEEVHAILKALPQ